MKRIGVKRLPFHTAPFFAALFLVFAATALGQPQSAPATSDDDKEGTLYVTSTAHLDTQWVWTIQDTIAKHIPKTLKTNFALFEKFPDYVFSFEGAFRYGLMKEYYPEDYERLKDYIAKGRWRVTGSSVDAGDVNIPSPESLFRQILYGNGFFQKEFGKTSIDIFLPDCFGFGYALPSVAAHCGLKGFSTQKLGWGAAEPVPFDVGAWEGPDGGTLVAVLNPGGYTSKIREDLSADEPWIQRINEMKEKCGFGMQMKYFGVGDTGGGPDDESVEWLEKSIKGEGPLRVLSTGADQIYRDMTPGQVAKLPRHKGELLMKIHGAGCYTSQAAMKRWNRKNELLADAAERAAVMAHRFGALDYPQKILHDAWVRFLWHQFHDDLTGTSIPQAYLFSWNDEALSENQFQQVLDAAAGAVIRTLDTRVQGVPLAVFNPLSIDRNDAVEATVKFQDGTPKSVLVFGPDGKEVPSQVVGADDNSVRVVFNAKVLPLSWTVFDVRPSDTPCAIETVLKVTKSTMENERYSLRLNDDGDVLSLRDRVLGKELLASPARLQILTDDSSQHWPAWEVRYEDVMAPPREYVGGPASARIVESGPARAAIEVARRGAGSTFIQRIRLAAGDAGDRVEFDTRIDWKTTGTLLKATFPLTATNASATYDLGLGTIDRGTNTENKYEVPAQQWADLTASDSSFGVAVLNDSKYGWDKPDERTLRLTLLHTPITKSAFVYQDKQDIGLHKILYAVCSHKGDWRNGVASSAARLNQPLVAWQTLPHEGRSGKSMAFLRVGSPDVAVRALKRSENGDEIVIRLQEVAGREQKDVVLRFMEPIESARAVTGAEQPLAEITPKDGGLVLDFTPYQPRTIALKLRKLPLPFGKTAGTPLPVAYNLDGVSNPGDKTDGDFDGEGSTYPGELWPATLNNCGVPFRLGSAEDGKKNFLSCQGQKLPLPKSNKPLRLYLLAAAVGGDTEAFFAIDGKPISLLIQDFKGRVAQWDNFPGGGDATAGFDRAYRKSAPVAWIGTHRHQKNGTDTHYEFCYLFQYALDMPAGARSLTLPENSLVRVAAMTIADNPNADVRRASPRDPDLYAFPRIQPAGEVFLHPVLTTIRCDSPDAVIRYTTDGTIPTDQSPRYKDSITIDRTLTLTARAFLSGGEIPLVTSASFTKAVLQDPVSPAATAPGLEWKYFEGTWDEVPDFDALKPAKSGTADSVSIEPRSRDENFGFLYTGFIDVPRDGMYRFFTKSDDGSCLWIGDSLVVDNDKLHGATERSGAVALRKGKHPLRIGYFQKRGDYALEVNYDGPGIPKQPLPPKSLSHSKEAP